LLGYTGARPTANNPVTGWWRACHKRTPTNWGTISCWQHTVYNTGETTWL